MVRDKDDLSGVEIRMVARWRMFFFYVDGVVENGGFVGLYKNGVDGRKSLKVEKWRKSVKVEEERRK